MASHTEPRMTHSPDHAERADLISRSALKAKLDALITAAAKEWGTGSQQHNLIRDVSGAVASAPAASLRGREQVMEAASLTLMYLQTGFVECDQCGHEIKTSDMDATYALAEVVEPWKEDARAALHDAKEAY